MSNNNELSKVAEEIASNLLLFKKIARLVELTDQISTLEKERNFLCKNLTPSDYISLVKILKENKDSEDHSLGEAYVKLMPNGEKKTYSESSVGGVSLF